MFISFIAAVVVEIWSSLGRQFWDLASTTSTVASAQSARLRLLSRQSNSCIMAGVELQKYAFGHEMSNQGNATQHKAGDPWGNPPLSTTSTTFQLHFFALHNLYLGPF